MVQAVLNLWVLYEPTMYVLQNKNDQPKFSLRYVNLGVLFVLVIFALTVLHGSR